MKVDVYPNITNVEVYENPISVPVEATWEKVTFTVPDPVVTSYDLGRQVATDRDGDYVIQVHYNATVVEYGDDFTVSNTQINWVSDVALAAGEEIIVWYSPKSAYGSVPGSGEVSSLTHLNDVTIAGPLAGHMLMRDGDGQFVNRHLTAGDNVTITSNGDGVTIAATAADIATASTIAEGKVRLATLAESSGNSNTLAVTPAGLQAEISTIASTDLSDSADLARLASPNLTGTPTAPTPAFGDDSTKLATTAYVQDEIAGLGSATSVGNAGNMNVADGNGSFSSTTWEVSNNNLLPTADDTYDIGSPTRKVRDIYVGNNSLKLGDNNTPLRVNANGDLEFGTDEVLTDATLATVATSGQYADLLGAPTLSDVATSGEYADLTGAPTLSTVATSGAYSDLSGAPTLSNVATSGAYADLSGTPTLSTVANTGDYSDLIGAPALSNVATSGAYADLSGTPTLSAVATSGSYNDLSDKPAIPSASTDLSDTADLARLASPSFTGTPTAPTPALGDDSTKIATTAYVQDEITNIGGVNSLDDLSDVTISGTQGAGEVVRYNGTAWVDSTLASADLSDSTDLARLASPNLTGNPTAPTPAGSDNSTSIATTAYVQTEITNMSTVDALNDLSDVTVSGTQGAGEVIRYSGTGWVDAQLSYNDLSNTPTLPSSSDDLTSDHTGVNYTGANTDSITTHLAGIDSALASVGASDLNGLSDVTITSAATGEVLRYSGTSWVDSALASTDLSDSGQLVRSSDVGTAAAEDIGTTIGDVVQLEDVSGSAGLPAVDASQLTGLSATQVGALANINNESLNDLSDVNFTAGAGIDGFSLVYNHGNTRWEASQVLGAATPTLISANTALNADTHYVVDPSITSGLLLNVPNSNVTDGAQILVTNLSTQAITIELYDTSGQAKLYYADGTLAPTPTIYRDRITVESQGTIRLYQAGAGNPVEWYLYHSPAFEVEAPTDELATAQALAYSTQRKAFVSAGEIHGEKILSANVSSTVYPYHLYATAYDETTARTVSLPDRKDNEDLVSELNGQRVYFENRGTSTLTVNLFNNYAYTGGVYYRAYLRRFDNTQISGNTYTLHPGERVEVEVETEDFSSTDLRVHYRLGKHRPVYETTTDTSGTNSTISHGREQHLTYVVDTANNVSVTLPSASDVKPDYRITIKSIGAGTTTVTRAGSDTFDAETTTDLSQYDFLSIQRRSASGWAILANSTETTPTSLVSDTDPTLGGDLDVSTFDIVSSSGNNIEVAPDGSGKLIVKGNATGGSAGITLNCESNTHGVTIKSPPHASNATYTLTLPDDAGSANELLKTNGSGGLSWSLVGGNDVVVPHTGVNYTAANTDTVTTHLSAIDTALAGAGGGWTYAAISADPANAQTGYHYSCTGSFTLTLPTSGVNAGEEIRVKNMGSGTITIDPQTSNIDGSTTDYVMDVQYGAITLVSTGTHWEII